MPMPSNINIGRYEPDHGTRWTGYIEGTDARGEQWITYLNEHGQPELHWPHREDSGAVVGEPIVLT